MVYETDLLNPVWWVDSLLGSMSLLIIIVEFWILSFLRKIPNITLFSIVIMVINGLILLYGIFSGEGMVLSQSMLGLLILIFGIIAWSNYNDS